MSHLSVAAADYLQNIITRHDRYGLRVCGQGKLDKDDVHVSEVLGRKDPVLGYHRDPLDKDAPKGEIKFTCPICEAEYKKLTKK